MTQSLLEKSRHPRQRRSLRTSTITIQNELATLEPLRLYLQDVVAIIVVHRDHFPNTPPPGLYNGSL